MSTHPDPGQSAPQQGEVILQGVDAGRALAADAATSITEIPPVRKS